MVVKFSLPSAQRRCGDTQQMRTVKDYDVSTSHVSNRFHAAEGIVEVSGIAGLSFLDRPQMLLDLDRPAGLSSFFVSLLDTAVSGRFFSLSGVLEEVDSSMYFGL